MRPGRRVIFALFAVAFLTAVGTVGYMLISGMSPIEALYMSVITISTVGLQEVKPLTSAGRIFTIGLIVTGVGSAMYLFATVAGLLIEGHLREFLGRTAMQHRIHQLEGHIVICGYGRFGKAVTEELLRSSMSVVVIDHDQARQAELTQADVPFIIGSALEDSVLEEAGIRRARAIVVATASDADNVYLTLSAREKNPAIRIHARGESEAGLRRLKLAGADQALSAYQWGGARMAASIVRPAVVDFLELSIPGRGAEVDLEEVRITPGSSIIGRTIKSLEEEGQRLRIVALKREGQGISLIPDSGTVLAAGDYLVVIGERGGLKRLTDMVA